MRLLFPLQWRAREQPAVAAVACGWHSGARQHGCAREWLGSARCNCCAVPLSETVCANRKTRVCSHHAFFFHQVDDVSKFKPGEWVRIYANEAPEAKPTEDGCERRLLHQLQLGLCFH